MVGRRLKNPGKPPRLGASEALVRSSSESECPCPLPPLSPPSPRSKQAGRLGRDRGDGGRAPFRRANPVHAIQGQNEDLAVSDLTGPGRP